MAVSRDPSRGLEARGFFYRGGYAYKHYYHARWQQNPSRFSLVEVQEENSLSSALSI